MTASGKIELATTTDETSDAAGMGLRVGSVGLSGGFGSITLGNQWSAIFNSVGTNIDTTRYAGGATNLSLARTGNTIKYANSVGPLSLEMDLRVDDDSDMDHGDGVGWASASRSTTT